MRGGWAIEKLSACRSRALGIKVHPVIHLSRYSKLSFYLVQYKITRGSFQAQINIPSFTTALGLKEDLGANRRRRLKVTDIIKEVGRSTASNNARQGLEVSTFLVARTPSSLCS